MRIQKSSKPSVSIIIRTKNEERYLEQIFKIISKQTFQNFEIIVVDDNSEDNTLNISQKYPCRIINVPKGKFSHPFTCNLGAKHAKGKYLAFLNGHSIPQNKNWLQNGLKKFDDKKVCAVSCLTIAHKDATLVDKIVYNTFAYTIGNIRIKNFLALRFFGTTNGMIRKNLWEKHNFVETVNQGWGGEDWEWVLYWKNKGYKTISDPKFKTRHSHHLSFKQMLWQFRNWARMSPKNTKLPEKQIRNF